MSIWDRIFGLQRESYRTSNPKVKRNLIKRANKLKEGNRARPTKVKHGNNGR